MNLYKVVLNIFIDQTKPKISVKFPWTFTTQLIKFRDTQKTKVKLTESWKQ